MAAKSREEIRANREGTSKAGKGPLKHHEQNREGPGQKKRERSTEGKQSKILCKFRLKGVFKDSVAGSFL